MLKDIPRLVRIFLVRRDAANPAPVPREGFRRTVGAMFRSMTRGRLRETAPAQSLCGFPDILMAEA